MIGIVRQQKGDYMKLLGITDSVNECDCCGKTDLKCTVVFETSDLQIVHYGRTCASKHYGQPTKQINNELRTIAEIARSEARAEYRNHPDTVALEQLIAKLNKGPKLTFLERWEIVKPYSDAESKACKEIEQKYCERYMLKSICVY